LDERPLLLIAGDGKLVGLAGPEGRALSAASGGGFAAESWLENDGDLAAQTEAAARVGFQGPKGERWFNLAGLQAVALSGKGAVEKLPRACAEADLVILAADVEAMAPDDCALIDAEVLTATGALAITMGPEGLRFQPTRGASRLWSPPVKAPGLPVLAKRQ
jgi:competence protein ComEC